MHVLKASALFILFTLQIRVHEASEIFVDSKVGRIAGFLKEIDIDGESKILTEFLGIPYAEDTSGQNRFARPVPKAPFNGTFKAFTISPPCMQESILNAATFNMTEDCLMLNLYVPFNLSSNTGSSLAPVMIFIHGGAFVSGTASFYNGEALSAFGGVIVVTINYRLAEFGFLNVGDARAMGNQGLWDQQLAIKWVKNNIQAFKGDPDKITIFGESAGASSVTFQTLHAGNKGLFKRAIAESGSGINNWFNTALPNVDRLYKATGCDNGTIDPVECLKQISARDLLIALNKPELTGCCSPSPTLDHDFIIENPVDIAFGSNNKSSQARQFFRSLDLLTGINNGEGALGIYYSWTRILGQSNMDNMTVTPADFRNIVAPFIISNTIRPPNNKLYEALSSAICFEYATLGDFNDDHNLRKSLMNLAADIDFFTPAVLTVKAHSSSIILLGRSYFYEFSVEPPLRSIPTPVWFRGANHGDELLYVLGYPFLNESTFEPIQTARGPTVTWDDKNIALGMMTAWSNFAKSGNPNFPGNITKYLHSTWPQYEPVNQQYLEVSLNTSTVKKYFNARSTAFWTQLIPAILSNVS